MSENSNPPRSENKGTARLVNVRMANFPTADDAVRQAREAMPISPDKVDILLVNPPAPDGGIWIRSQHRVGRRSRENMIWPQVSLVQMAAMLHPTYKVKVIDAIAERMGWKEFERQLDRFQPNYYLTQVTAPTLQNDMYGAFLARARGAKTIAFGTHVTPIPVETMLAFPALDFILYGEPDLSIRDLLDTLENRATERPPEIQKMFDRETAFRTSMKIETEGLGSVLGIVWRKGDEIIQNMARPFVELDDLPIPMHHLLPLQTYKMPMMKGPFTFIVSSRGCPAGCTFCIKHVSYQFGVRVRSAAKIMEELWILKKLGISNIHMYADLFTVNRDQVVELCNMMIDQKIGIKWTCNSRVDYVDEEMLKLMRKAGCWFISWGLESANPDILKHAHKGITPERVRKALLWSNGAGIKNWGYFIIGLPGETETTIQETITYAKSLPLDIALFHIAAPYPGTPFFFEVVKEGWFRKGTRWEQVDMDKETVLDYPDLPRDRLMYWQKRAFREWAFRPGPMFTYLKMLLSDPTTFKSALSVGLQHLSWQAEKAEK